MADMSAENAFLQTLGTAAPSGEQNSDVSYEPASAPVEDEDDEYDPSNLVTPSLDLPTTAQRTSTTPVSQQSNGAPKITRLRGGFVESDDEDDNEGVDDGQAAAGTNGLLNGAGAAGSVQRSLIGTPNNALTTASVPIQSTEEIPSHESSVLPASNISLLTDINGAVATSKAASAQLEPQGSIVSSLPKARLPQDRVGQLEDRVAADPRGDIDAWLELMHEHQARGKTAEARDIYERYLKIFPTAVGFLCLVPPQVCWLTVTRPASG
jgi:cleavage stimulation factor subunit 3